MSPRFVFGRATLRRPHCALARCALLLALLVSPDAFEEMPRRGCRGRRRTSSRWGNAVHTALQYDLLAEDVLITGAGPIGAMAAAVCKYAGAKNVVITDINPERLALAKQLGATRTVDVRTEKLADVQRELGMSEGFDVGLEMSGNPSGFRDLLANMCHGGKVAMLGIPGEEMAIDWSQVIFNMLTLKGIYGREMYPGTRCRR